MLTDQEFESILADESKLIEGDLRWHQDRRLSHIFVFWATVQSDAAWPLKVRGRLNVEGAKLAYMLLHEPSGCIVRLELGKVKHRNPSAEWLIGTHKHRWSEQFRDKQAYVPDDITYAWDKPRQVWIQFCDEIGVSHLGNLRK